MTVATGPSFGGVGLEQYAGVTAALAEELPLEDVCAQDGLDPAAWPAAERAWREALVPAPDLQLRYLALRRQAEDCLARRIEPLDDDPEAWTGLLTELALGGGAVLGRLGLRPSDVARLGRAWTKKAADDRAVHERLTELAGKGRVPESVRAEASRLSPFPWSPGAKAAGPAPAAVAASGAGAAALQRLRERTPAGLPIEHDVDVWAALVALCEIAPELLDMAFELCGVAHARRQAVGEGWRERLRADAALRARFVVLAADHRGTLADWLAPPR